MTRRVLLVGNKLGNGGAERVLTHVANGLQRSGWQVGMFLFRRGGEYEALLHPDIHIHHCQQFEPRALFLWVAGYALSRVAQQYDLVYAGGGGSDVTVAHHARLLVRRHAPSPLYLARVANTISHAFSCKPKKVAHFQKIVPGFASLIVPSHGVKADVEQLLAQRTPPTHVIYNPVDFELIERMQSAPIDCDCPMPFFLNVGRLSHQKDHGTLIRAFADFSRQTGTPHHLVILGRGGEKARLQQLCQELGVENKVLLRGFTVNPWAYMSRATAVISSSVVEGMSNVILEAIACRTPVIGTDCPSGTAEILQGQRHGYLVPMRDPAAMAAAMRQVVEQPDDASARAERAYAFIQQQNVNAVVQRYLHTFEQLLSQPVDDRVSV